jgi:hypothetical protein
MRRVNGENFYDLNVLHADMLADSGDPLATAPDFILSPNFPNPFNQGTTLRILILEPGPVEVAVYNILGQKVYTVPQEFRDAGPYTVEWDGTESNSLPCPSGVYICRVKAATQTETMKMVKIR